jgi:hypothetical protein
MKHIQLFEEFIDRVNESSDKKVGEFLFKGKKYDIFQDSNDDLSFGIKSGDSWEILAMGDEFNPETFDMNLKEMLAWIDEGIKYFTNLAKVSSKDVKDSEWSDFFQNEFDESVKLDKFYVLGKLTCGKENAKNS